MKAEAKTRAQAHVQSIMEEAQLNAKNEARKLLSRPFRELVQNRLSKTQFLFSILNLMR
jgi:ribonuclease Y